MENNDRTLKELATPNVVYQPWCIQYPQLEHKMVDNNRTLKELATPNVILASGDPHKHLKEFHVVCSTIRPHGIPHHQISEQLLIQYFYERLMLMNKSMIYTASGGALMSCYKLSRRQKSISLSLIPSNKFQNMQGSSRNCSLIRGRI
ncbi:hypothetical protein CR513_49125, partial [Mucuna pruriens]